MSKVECEYKKYGFNPPSNEKLLQQELEIRLLFKDSYGVLHGQDLMNNKSIRWNKKGICMTHCLHLTPLCEKPWYEYKDNRFKLVVVDEDSYGILMWWYRDSDELAISILKEDDSSNIYKTSQVRLATKEDALSLLGQEKINEQ